MTWRVKRIQECDYECEERTEDERAKVLVTLENEVGDVRIVTADDEWLYANGVEEGDVWSEQ